MYSKLLIWSTINTKSAIRTERRIFLVGLPSLGLTEKTSPAFTQRGISELSLEGEAKAAPRLSPYGKVSGISMEIYCCLPKPEILLLTCHNVASAFLQTSGETGPSGERLYRALWREKLARVSTRKEPWAKPGRSCSGKSPADAKAGLGSSEMGLVLPPHLILPPHLVLPPRHDTDPTPPTLVLARLISWSERQRDFWLSKDQGGENKIGSQGSSPLNRQKHTTFYLQAEKTQFAILMKFLHSAELNASAADGSGGKLARPPYATYYSS